TIDLPDGAAMGVAVEGSASVWPGAKEDAVLPRFDSVNQQKHYLDVFRRGKESFEVIATASESWIKLSATSAKVEGDRRIEVNIDWQQAPKGASSATVKLSGAGQDVAVKINALTLSEISREKLDGLMEDDGVVSIEAAHFTKNVAGGKSH